MFMKGESLLSVILVCCTKECFLLIEIRRLLLMLMEADEKC